MDSRISGLGEPHPPLLRRARPWQLQKLDLFIASALGCLTLAHLFRPGPGAHEASVLALGFGVALPLAIRRRAPLFALGAAVLALSIATAVGQSVAPDPLVAIPVYQVASVRDRHTSVLALLLSALALVIAATIGAAGHPSEGDAGLSALVAVAAWFVGDSARVRRAYNAGIAEQAAQRSSEELARSERSLAEERLRIARELHDVVAHCLSVIAVQSGVGRHVIDEQPDAAKAALAAVESTSRSALSELRRMLGVLRRGEDDGEDPGLAPAPGVADLPALVEQVRAAGVPVELQISGAAERGLSPALELTVYRIVQEALTNVVRHAGPARAWVTLGDDSRTLRVEVRDDGAPMAYPRPAPDAVAHHGILGMRERVQLFGGTLHAGPSERLGFEVLALLPLEPPEP